MDKLRKIKDMEKEFIYIIRVILILDNGSIISSLKVNNLFYLGIISIIIRYSFTYIKAFMFLRMVSLTKDKLIMEKPDMVSIDMLMVMFIKDSGTRILNKAMASCIIQTEIHMKVNGSKAKRMDMALTIIIMVLFIKVTLLMVEKMEWV